MTRKAIAKDTLDIIKKGYYINTSGDRISLHIPQKQAERDTRIYHSDDLDLSPNEYAIHETKFEVNKLTTLDAVRTLYNEGIEEVLCLNFASARNPGGGFLKGSQAQEESIARASGLYNCQLKAEHYYVSNRKFSSCLYTDLMIYSPKVPVFKLENGQLMNDFIPVSIITAPAANTGAIARNEPHNLSKVKTTMIRRIASVLAIALENGHEHLVLGAWGCGVFRNDPDEIAKLFKEALDGPFKNCFKTIVFAVYSSNKRFVKPFLKEFN